MKLFTWNVKYNNKNPEEGLDYIFSQSPDVVSCQEILLPQIKYIEEKFGYFANPVIDYYKRDTPFNYLVLFTKIKPIKVVTIETQSFDSSLMTKILFKWEAFVDTRKAISLTLEIEGKVVQIIGAHPSSTVRSTILTKQIQEILAAITQTPAVVIGDFNTFEKNLWNLATGFLRGFKKEDYKLSEIDELFRVSKEKDLQPLFNEDTFMGLVPRIPLDNIIISKGINVIEKSKLGQFESDHNILYAEVAV